MSESLARLLLDLIVKPGIAFGLAALVSAALRRQSASLRHHVWAAALVVALVLPVLRFVVPAVHLRVLDVEAGAGPVTPTTHLDDARSPTGPSGDLLRRGATTRSGTQSAHRAWHVDWPAAITITWMVGLLVLGGRLVVAHRRARRIAVRSRAFTPRLSRRRDATLRVSQEVATPIVVGVTRPLVILPQSAVTWSDEDLEAVLAHELAHVERRDTAFALVAQVACVVYWCNPLSWMAAAALTREAERACDDRVLSGGGNAAMYGRLLLRFAAANRVDATLPSVATAMARRTDIETRLLAILDPRVRRDAPARWLSAAVGFAALSFAAIASAVTLDAAPIQVPRRTETPPAVTTPLGSEPDTRGDSVASPSSERVPDGPSAARVQRALATALTGPDSILARILGTGLGHRPTSPGDLVYERTSWALAQERNTELVTPLLDSLASRDWRVQAYAAWALAYARNDLIDARIAPLLDHPVWRVRAMAASVLRGTRDAPAQRAYDRALHDDAWQVRTAAVEHVAALGDAATIERLRPLLRDRHIAVRHAAVAALAGR
jgi:beta-lactamase regulating signal transducer with metallopeptidase domain